MSELKRMCSECRAPIGNVCMTSGGLYYHPDCEPTVHDATDDQLRAECERRGIAIDDDGWEWTTQCHGCGRLARFDNAADRDAADAEHESVCPLSATTLKRDRDEWKRRADELGRQVATLKARYLALPSTATLLAEGGPGIAAQRPDNAVDWLDEELLCADE